MTGQSITGETIGTERPVWYKSKHDNTKVGIAVSTFGNPPVGFQRSLAAVMRYSMNQGVLIDLVMDEAKPLDVSRNQTVRDLMEGRPDYIFFMDSDMIFAKETLVDLIKQDKDIISGVYCQKVPPHNPILKMYNEKEKRYQSLWTYPRGSIFTVDAAGCGCLLVKSKVFKDLKKPYFYWDKPMGDMTNKGSVSEDIYFCAKARKAGYKIHVHGGMDCGHFTDMHFITPADFFEYYKKYNDKIPITTERPKQGISKMDYLDKTEIEDIK